jgi:heat shock protein HtpX
MSIYAHRDSNVRKTWALFTVFLLVVIGIGWFFSYLYDTPLILIVAVVFSVVMNVVGYWFSDKLVLKMTGARAATRAEFFDLYTSVENLAITAGLPSPKVYIISDPAPNAFATGRNPEHAVVAVTTGLLAILNKTELEGVLAHELAHIGNRDMFLSTAVVVLVGFITILSDIFLRSTAWGGRGRDNKAGGALVLIGLGLAILAPIAATLIRLAISRKREFLADASGALLTRYPEGLASALEKISTHAQPLRRANDATAHLFIANPFLSAQAGGKVAKGLHKLFMTHPPVEERLRALRG